MRRLLLTFVVAIALASTVFAQQAAAPAPLTDVTKLQIINAFQAVEIAELKLREAIATREAVMKSVTVPGYQLNEKLEYVPMQEQKK